MNVREGLLTFSEKGNGAILKDSKKLHDKKALMPVSKTKISYEEQKRALSYLMFLKQKRDVSIKAHGCADGRPQREYMTKDEANLPTVSLEAMMLSCAIDTKEGRYVIVTNIPRAFPHADMEDHVHMLLKGTISELITKLEPSIYRKYIWYNQKGTYVVCQAEKSPICYITSSTTVLQIALWDTTGVGIQD